MRWVCQITRGPESMEQGTMNWNLGNYEPKQVLSPLNCLCQVFGHRDNKQYHNPLTIKMATCPWSLATLTNLSSFYSWRILAGWDMYLFPGPFCALDFQGQGLTYLSIRDFLYIAAQSSSSRTHVATVICCPERPLKVPTAYSVNLSHHRWQIICWLDLLVMPLSFASQMEQDCIPLSMEESEHMLLSMSPCPRLTLYYANQVQFCLKFVWKGTHPTRPSSASIRPGTQITTGSTGR